MHTRGIRGAITINNNTKEEIEKATVELLSDMLRLNHIQKEEISHIIFTLTNDIDADFPPKYARQRLGFDYVAMICSNEIPVEGSMPLCIRVLMVVNTILTQKEIQHVYLNNAINLRPDIGIK